MTPETARALAASRRDLETAKRDFKKSLIAQEARRRALAEQAARRAPLIAQLEQLETALHGATGITRDLLMKEAIRVAGLLELK